MNFWRITRKDLLVLWRDRRSLVILLALPLVFITIIGLSTGQLLGWQNDNGILKIAVVNQDGGDLSRSIIDRLRQHEGLDVQELDDPALAERLVASGDRTGVVRFGPEFQRQVDEVRSIDALQMDRGRLAGDLSTLDVHVAAEQSLTNVEAILEVIVHGEVLRGVVPHVLQKNAWIRNYIRSHSRGGAAADTAPAAAPKARPRQEQRYGNLIYQTIVPSYTVLFAFFLVTIMAGSFLAERDAGTLRRLQSLPVAGSSVIAGKTFPFLLISLGQVALLFLAGKLLFGMSWGRHPLWLPVVIFGTSLSATSLGLLVATVVRTTSQVSTYATLIILVMAGISGCFMPRHWLPPAMQQIGLATPHAWALIAFNELLNTRDPDLPQVARCVLVLLGMSGGYLLLGWWRFLRSD